MLNLNPQMMESMITNFRPTRAEANDAANGFLYGADALMLSGETSTFPAGSICSTASFLSQKIKAKAIIVFTHSGYTAVRISSHRPKAAIYTFTGNKKLLIKFPWFGGFSLSI
jgi:pyruvate kinase